MGLRVRRCLEAAAFRSAVTAVWWTPPWLATRIAWILAAVVHRLLPRKLTRYHVAAENIRASFPELDEAAIDGLIFRMWWHLFRMVAEIVQLERRWKLIDVLDLVRFRQKPEALKALLQDRPVLLLTGHFGNWEMANSTFGKFGFRMGVVARDLDNPSLDAWFRAFREFTGHYTISKSGAAEAMTAELGRGGRVAMLGDQDAGPNGVFVDFFGRPASTFKSIALLAMQYDALIVVGTGRRLDETLPDGWPIYEVSCDDVIDPREFTTGNAVREITHRYTLALEQAVRRSPEQYFWVHRRWKSVPRVRQRKAA